MVAPTDVNQLPASDPTQVARAAGAGTAVVPSVRAPAALGPYRILRQLGRGGMGAVYAALDTRLDRKIALKVMLPQFAADHDARERFLREARAAAQVAHDNVVTVYEADERDGVPYIAMQYLEGYPLDEYLKRKGLPNLPQVLRIARETAAGLAAAHRIGLVHRDIKPGNLWLEAPNGRVKVLDFGLAKPVDTEAELTQSGEVIGTPAYMSPEQARGEKVDARTDLFSLGVVLYRLCTSRLPFQGPTTMAVLMALGTEEPPPVRELNPDVPEALAALIHQLLAKSPDDRPQSANDVVKRVRALTESTGASQVVVTPAPRVVYVPIQLTPVGAANPFANLDATEAEPVPMCEPVAEPVDAPVRKKPRTRWLWPAVGGAVLLALVAAAAATLSKGNSGSETKAEASDGTTKGKSAKPAPKPADPDRKAAEWVLSVGGVAMVTGQDREFRSAAELPKGPFTLGWLNLTDRPVTDDELACFKECKGLTSVTLHGTKVTDAGVAHFKNCKELTSFSFAHTAGTDAALVHLKGCTGLTHLWVQDTGVTNAGLVHLKEFKQLAVLFAGRTGVTDAGLVHLKELKGLTVLDLDGTQVTDAGLEHLKELTGLTSLSVRMTGVTPKGLNEFRAAVPGCRIDHDGGTIEAYDPNRAAAEWVLSLGGFVRANGQDRDLRAVTELPKDRFVLTFVDVAEKPVTGTELARLKDCKELTELHLRATRVTDEGLVHLKDLTKLKLLDLAQLKVTGAGLSHLTNLADLDTLLLNGTGVTDAGLMHLKGCKGLKRLVLEGTPVTGTGLTHLTQLAKLECLELQGSALTDVGMGPLENFKGLKQLDLNRTKITGTGLVHIAGLTGLAHLGLAHTGTTDAAAPHLAGLKNLEELSLQSTAVTDAGLVHLKGLAEMQRLDLSGTAVTGSGFVHLGGYKRLEHLSLSATKVTDAALAHLAGLPVQHLVLNDTPITGPGLVHVKSLPELVALHLDGTAVTDAALLHLSGHRGLPHISVDRARVTERGLRAFHATCPWRQITYSGGTIAAHDPNRVAAEWVISAGGAVRLVDRHGKPLFELPKDPYTVTGARLVNRPIGDDDLARFVGCRELTELVLFGTKVTDAGVAHLKALAALTNLDVRKTGVTAKGVEELRAALPKCKIEHDGGVIEPKK